MATELIGRVVAIQPNGLPWLMADLPVDIPGALPGELVRYEELGRGSHRARGRLLEVLEPHPDRIAPPCPLVEACGSCDLMHLRIASQRALKQARVTEALAPFHVEIEPIVTSPLEWGYRRRARFTFFGTPGDLRLGAWRAGTHDLLDLERCPVTDPGLLHARDKVKEALSKAGLEPYLESTGQGILRHLLLQIDPASRAVIAVLVVAREADLDWTALADSLLEPVGSDGAIAGVFLNLQADRGNALTGRQTRHLAGLQALSVRMGDHPMHLPGGAFSQVNLEVAGLLYRQAAAWALAPGDLSGGGPVGSTGGQIEKPEAGPVTRGRGQPGPASSGGVLDLYCGVGALGLHVAPHFPWGVGIELNADAISAAERAAREASLSGWRFLVGEVDTVLAGLELPGPVALAIINPPRKGLGPRVIDALLERRPARLLYVSCNPTSLARDLHRFSTDYRVTRAQPFDMFPHTHHVETLVRLDRISRYPS